MNITREEYENRHRRLVEDQRNCQISMRAEMNLMKSEFKDEIRTIYKVMNGMLMKVAVVVGMIVGIIQALSVLYQVVHNG